MTDPEVPEVVAVIELPFQELADRAAAVVAELLKEILTREGQNFNARGASVEVYCISCMALTIVAEAGRIPSQICEVVADKAIDFARVEAKEKLDAFRQIMKDKTVVPGPGKPQ